MVIYLHIDILAVVKAIIMDSNEQALLFDQNITNHLRQTRAIN